MWKRSHVYTIIYVGVRDGDYMGFFAGSVLITSDTAGRTLEILLILESHWHRSQQKFTIVLLSPVAYSTLEFAKSQLEWMNQDLSEQFSRTKLNPFDLRYAFSP